MKSLKTRFHSIWLYSSTVLEFLSYPVASSQNKDMATHQCASCQETGDNLKRCTGCKSVWYCNVACQRAHRKHHKKECRERAQEMAAATDVQKLSLAEGGDGVTGSKSSSISCKRDEDERTCWICLDEEGPEEGEPLLRDCACRGNAGFVHVACATKNAKTKSDAAFDALANAMSSGAKIDAVNVLDKFRHLWTYCPNCEQMYEGRLGMEVAEAFVRATSLLSRIDFRRILAETTLAQANMRNGNSDAAHGVFSDLGRRLKEEMIPYQPGSFQAAIMPLLEYEIYNELTEIEYGRENYSKAYELVTYLRTVITRAYGPNNIFTEMLVAKQTHYRAMAAAAEGDDNTKSAVEMARKELKLAMSSSHGPHNHYVLQCKKDLVTALGKDQQFNEACALGKDLIECAERAFGKDHKDTQRYRKVYRCAACALQLSKEVKPKQDQSQKTFVMATVRGFTQSPDLNDRTCFVIKATKDDKYIAYVTPDDDGNRPMKKYKIQPANVEYINGTKVYCRGLKSLPDGTTGEIVGYNGEKGRYETKLQIGGSEGQQHQVKLIKPENLRIMF